MTKNVPFPSPRLSRRGLLSAGTGLGIGIAALSLTGCGDDSGGPGSGGKTSLEFFQSKSESIDVVDELIAQFQKDHPDITVEQTSVPDPYVALQTRLARGDLPDVLGINVSVLNGISSSDLLTDLAGTAAAKAVTTKGAQDYVNQVDGVDQTVAVPWSLNAVGVLYDVDAFSELGIEVPRTWSELTQAAEKIKKSGQEAFYFTWKDGWTAKAPFNAMAGGAQGEGFWGELKAGTAKMSQSPAYRTAATNMLALKKLGNKDALGVGYDDGNATFAQGKCVMYPQGIWAIPVIKDINPDKNIGMFHLPATDSPDSEVLVSGTDSVLAIPQQTKNADAAQLFVDYLLSADAQRMFTEDQFLISVRNDVEPVDPALSSLKKEWLDAGRTGVYPDSMVSGSSQQTAILQEFLSDGKVDRFLQRLDEDYAQNAVK